jgi:hypothetical protein
MNRGFLESPVCKIVQNRTRSNARIRTKSAPNVLAMFDEGTMTKDRLAAAENERAGLSRRPSVWSPADDSLRNFGLKVFRRLALSQSPRVCAWQDFPLNHLVCSKEEYLGVEYVRSRRRRPQDRHAPAVEAAASVGDDKRER